MRSVFPDDTSPIPVAAVRDLAAGDSVRLVVRGHSMRPLLDDGTMIRVRARRVHWPGDVIAFLDGGRLLVHRVLGYRPGPGGQLRYLVQGDNAPAPDAPVPPGEVIGRVVAVGSLDGPVVIGWRERLRAIALFTRLVWRRTWRFGRPTP